MNPILKELGVQEWEIHNPDFRKFYEWLDNNITAENILTEEEKESYDTIPPDERLEGVALQQEMDRIEKKYPGVMDVTPELLERTNEKAAQLADTLAVYQKIADDLQKHDQQIQNDIVEASIAVRKADELLKTLGQQCNDRFQDIDQIEKSSFVMATGMANLMRRKNGIEGTFVHQIDLTEFYNRIEFFDHFVDQFMLTNFKTEEHSKIEEENQRDTDKLEMKETLWMTWKNAIAAESKVVGQRRIVSSLRQPINPMSMATIEVQLAELRKLNREFDVKIEMKRNEIVFALRIEADLNVDLTVQEYTQGKVDIARDRVKRIQDANAILNEQLMLADILWFMANTDYERIKRFLEVSVFERYESEALACSKRIELMRQTSFGEANSTFWHELQTAVGSPIGNCAENFVKMYKKMQAMCKQLKFQSYADDIDAVREKIGSMCEMLQKLLYHGVFSAPAYKDQLVMNKSYMAKAQLSLSVAELNKLRTRYISEYVKPMNQDKFFNAKQNLWIWFLTQPQDVLKVLASLKAAAAKSKKPVPKPTAGISRRK